MFLFGEYSHQLDEKGRIRIPAKLKEALGPAPVIMKGTDGCLFVYSQEQALKVFKDKFDSEKGSSNFSDVDKTKAMRLMASKTQQVEEDKQGRILLNPKLIEYAQIKKNIVSIGALDRVEIWSEERWNEYSKVDADAYDEIIKSLA